MRFVIFFSLVLLVFGSMGYYLYNRIHSAFSGTFLASKYFLAIYIFLFLSFFIGKIMENYSMNILSENLIRIGAISIGFFFYGLLFVLIFDLLRLINHFLPFYPELIRNNLQQAKLYAGTFSLLVIFALMTYGLWNAFTPRVKDFAIKIDKKVEGLSTLNVVAISDIHLGTMVNHTKTKRLIREIKQLDPDLILIAGDIIDDNIEAVKKYALMEYFNELNPRFGIHGIMGNHEYIGRSFTDIPYYENNNINMIIDSVSLIEDKFYIVGRDDLQARTLRKKERKTSAELTKGLDASKPIILLDHQPYGLEASAEAGVDLHFSGHTHNGQFWPLNNITKLIFEEDWGYVKKGNTHYYISCGYGTAGPPIRIGSHPEILNFKISFDQP